MIIELAYYDVSPRIVKAGEKTTVTIRPLGGHAAFKAGVALAVQFLPVENSREPVFDYDIVEAVADADGCLRVSYCFGDEQEYYLRVFHPEEVDMKADFLRNRYDPGRGRTFHLYALNPDLYGRRPYKGDLHSHSTGSDGGEAPAFVAANYRKNGYDFYAMTDHHNYQPSLECIEAYKSLPVDLLIVPGEEVHATGNTVHIVNFGGRSGVNEIFQKEPEKYKAEVGAIMAEKPAPPGVDAFMYASCLWVFREIAKAGGLSIFAHPHWLYDVYQIPDKMSEALFACGELCAFELLGGQEAFSNNVQTAFYQEQRAKGRDIPIVGSSDSHCSEDGAANNAWFNWINTIVFAERLDTSAIIDAIKGGYSVAAEKYPGENEWRVYGRFRMVKFAKFLLKYYFPPHDEACFEEGRLMKECVAGAYAKNGASAYANDTSSIASAAAAEILALMKGRVGAMLERMWGAGSK